MENFNHVCEEIENLNEKYLEHENESYFRAMEDSRVKIKLSEKKFENNYRCLRIHKLQVMVYLSMYHYIDAYLVVLKTSFCFMISSSLEYFRENVF